MVRSVRTKRAPLKKSLQAVWRQYQSETDHKIKLIDCYLLFVVFTLAVQLLYISVRRDVIFRAHILDIRRFREAAVARLKAAVARRDTVTPLESCCCCTYIVSY